MLTNSRAGLTTPRGGLARRFRELHRILTETDLQTLPLWQVGVERNALRVVDRLLARGSPPEPHAHLLGARALANRDFEGAAHHFARADGPDDAYLAVYSLAMAGRVDDAQRIARKRLRRNGEHEAWWTWMAETFGLASPGDA